MIHNILRNFTYSFDYYNTTQRTSELVMRCFHHFLFPPSQTSLIATHKSRIVRPSSSEFCKIKTKKQNKRKNVITSTALESDEEACMELTFLKVTNITHWTWLKFPSSASGENFEYLFPSGGGAGPKIALLWVIKDADTKIHIRKTAARKSILTRLSFVEYNFTCLRLSHSFLVLFFSVSYRKNWEYSQKVCV